MILIPKFPPDYPGAIVVPANLDNVYAPADHGNIPNKPKAFIIHTPEEKADNIEVTPTWFQGYHPDQRGSTHYYLDNDGDVYQCVPETWGAIANGLNGKPRPSWADAGSLNWQTLSVEVEGYAHNIATTLNATQFDALVRLVRHRCQHYKIPLDRAHIMGHYQLAWDRSDPGASFPWERFIAALSPQEEDMAAVELVWSFENARLYVLGQGDPRWITDAQAAADLEKAYGKPQRALSWKALQALGAK